MWPRAAVDAPSASRTDSAVARHFVSAPATDVLFLVPRRLWRGTLPPELADLYTVGLSNLDAEPGMGSSKSSPAPKPASAPSLTARLPVALKARTKLPACDAKT